MSITQSVAICGRANIDAIDAMTGGIRERMDSMRVNGATEEDWARLQEDASDLSFMLMSSELSMYERAIFEMTNVESNIRYHKRRAERAPLELRLLKSHDGWAAEYEGRLAAQFEVMSAMFVSQRRSAIHEDVTTICDAKELLRDAIKQLDEHKRRVA